MAAASDIAVWKVAFYGNPRGWERLVMRPGFRHCSALGYLAPGLWLEIDANLFRIETRVLTHAAYVDRLVQLELIAATTIDVEVRPKSGLRWSPTCAGVIAGLAGAKGALRPEGLYRTLMTHKRSAPCPLPDHLAQPATTRL
jgi:hypothetical protein